MLKNIIIALLAINTFYFVWMLAIGSSGHVRPSRTLKGVPTIELLPADNVASYKSGATSSSCYTFGPLSREQSAEKIAHKINSFGVKTEILRRETMKTLSFLVHIGITSNQDAMSIVKEMNKHGIKKYKLIESGDYKDSILLGSFDNIDKARRHAEYIRFLGFDARYSPRKKQKKTFWVDFDEPFGTNLPVSDWALEINRKVTAQKIPKACLDYKQ